MPPPSPANQPGPVGGAPDPGPPSAAERAYLARGLDQPGGKLPLFDGDGQAYPPGLIRACIRKGWATPWFANPMKPDWLVCRLTDAGRAVVREALARGHAARGDESEKGPAGQ